MRGPEFNFIQAAFSPVVFTDLIDNQLTFSSSLSVPFCPEELIIDDVETDGTYLYQPIAVPLVEKDPVKKTTIYGFIERNLSFKLLELMTFGPHGEVELQWQGKKVGLRRFNLDHCKSTRSNDVFFSLRKTKWWDEEE
eukprot:TRINITY_DN12334_c0_g1_i1.p1 TRINITY_DN12334_c0_g1~~TRINITY_DN12334_c0_g1_i1.p1  ORF type:complete len:138 (+),score=15.12 TRINITY_DN12334_c0_g1_i1:438-851(+)